MCNTGTREGQSRPQSRTFEARHPPYKMFQATSVKPMHRTILIARLAARFSGTVLRECASRPHMPTRSTPIFTRTNTLLGSTGAEHPSYLKVAYPCSECGIRLLPSLPSSPMRPAACVVLPYPSPPLPPSSPYPCRGLAPPHC